MDVFLWWKRPPLSVEDICLSLTSRRSKKGFCRLHCFRPSMIGMRLRGGHKLPVTKQAGGETIIMMHMYRRIIFVVGMVYVCAPFQLVAAQDPTPTTISAELPTPAEIIIAVNALRISHGLPALAVHSVLMQA